MKLNASPNAILIVCSLFALLYMLAGPPDESMADDRPALPVTGESPPQLAPLDELMTKFLREQQIPGGALAIARHGRLVYARGFGWADAENQQAVQPDSLFRIASVSKPITATAVWKLVRRKKLALDDPVEKFLDESCAPYLPDQVDRRWKQITIRQLLQHRGGWDRDVSYDPMFRPLEIARAIGTSAPAGPRDIIRYMRSQPLDFTPGSRYAYSNFGYCLLGRVIESCSGLSYEQFVQKEILAPIGIDDMRVGATRLAGRQPKEVRYYTKDNAHGRNVFAAEDSAPVPQPYGCWHLEAMDAHGGWIGSAPSLVRFAAAVQAGRLVNKAEWCETVARPEQAEGPTYYGLGWMVRSIRQGSKESHNLWHTGSLPGTAALLVIRHDGFCWAVLLNSRDTPSGEHPARLIDPLIHQAVGRVEEWPRGTALFRGRPEESR